jgi:hypothetical protein
MAARDQALQSGRQWSLFEHFEIEEMSQCSPLHDHIVYRGVIVSAR